MANLELVQKMRTQTGAGIMDIKQALEEANGDENQALEILRKKGRKIAAKKQAERTAKDGMVEAYIHAGMNVGFNNTIMPAVKSAQWCFWLVRPISWPKTRS